MWHFVSGCSYESLGRAHLSGVFGRGKVSAHNSGAQVNPMKTIFRNYDAVHLSRAVCGRASSAHVEAPFKINSIYLASVTPVRYFHQNCLRNVLQVQQVLEREKVASEQKLSANWNAADDLVEIVNPLTGMKAFGFVAFRNESRVFKKSKISAVRPDSAVAACSSSSPTYQREFKGR